MIKYDIETVPFSFYSSWMSLTLLRNRQAPNGNDGLYLCSYHGGRHAVARLQVAINGTESAYSIEATPGLLRLTGDANAFIEICFDGPETLRIRGSGLNLDLHMITHTLVYSEDADIITLNIPSVRRRYQIERLCGCVETIEAHDAADRKHALIRAFSNSSTSWELAIDEFWSTWERKSRRSFDECIASGKKEFADFLATMPSGPVEFERVRALAAYVDWSATVGPCGLLQRPTMLMSKNWMCSVWSWDNCFNAMALASGQQRLALDQIFVVADHQDEFGCYPDNINDVHIQYNFNKPPIHGWAISEMLRRFREPVEKETIESLYATLSRQTEWWLKHRRLADQNLPYYLHGNDSGWDNSTMFDRGVPLIAPDLAAFLVLQMDVLVAFAEDLGRPEEQEQWRKDADRLLQALVDELWQGNHFIARLARDNSEVPSMSLVPCVPILLGKRLPESLRRALASQIEGFLTEWGLATEHPESDEYKADGYWRGPIWAPSTYIIVCGLEKSGFHELATSISERFCRLCAKSGFAENYDALTGEALRDPAYTWTSSVYLLLTERFEGTVEQPDHARSCQY